MNINSDVLAGRQRKIRGCERLTLGEQSRDAREVTLGRLEYTSGVLQQRLGLVMWRMERGRARLSSRATE